MNLIIKQGDLDFINMGIPIAYKIKNIELNWVGEYINFFVMKYSVVAWNCENFLIVNVIFNYGLL